MKLHVIYKGQTIDISYDLLYINTDEVNIRFSNSNAQSCKFLTQYLEANLLDYVLKDREDYKEIVTLPDIFALTLSTKVHIVLRLLKIISMMLLLNAVMTSS